MLEKVIVQNLKGIRVFNMVQIELAHRYLVAEARTAWRIAL